MSTETDEPLLCPKAAEHVKLLTEHGTRIK